MSGGLRGPLWLVGCGKMGGALADGWLRAGLPPGDLTVVEPAAELRSRWRQRGAVTLATPGELGGPDRPAEVPRAVVIAVKPQQMEELLVDLHGRVPPPTAVVSIAAGVPIATFAQALGERRPIVRVMPNTPAAVGRGISALVANAASDAASRELAERLMAAVGETVWLEDESQMHAVTALSGGGPAYVFLLVETLTAAGTAQGLDPNVAARLALATVAGAGELARQSDEPPAQLRRNVTSPGGTTAEALAVLTAEDGLAPMIDRALRAAAARSRALGGEEPR